MMKRLFASAIFLCVLALPFSWQARTQTEPSGKALLEAYVSAWNWRDFPALDKLLASDAVHEDMARPSRDVGPDEIKRSIRTTIADLPDLNWHLTSIVDGGSLVAAEWAWTGTFIGGCLVVHDVEDRIQPYDLHHVLDLFREIEQLQFSTLRLHAGVGTDQMSQA